MKLALALVALVLLLAAPAAALGPGDLDQGFGDGGVVVTSLGPLAGPGESFAAANDVAALPDGRLLVVGTGPGADGEPSLTIARYRPDGKPDRSFGDGGTVALGLGPGGSSGAAIVGEPDGGAVVAGQALTSDGAPAVALARVDASGELDWGVSQQLGGGAAPGSSGLDAALQPDGRIVVAGSASAVGGTAEPFVARFVAENGALDPSFGDGGIVVAPAPRADPDCGAQAAEATAVVVRPAGTIAVAGRCGDAVALLREYSADGVGDPSTDGVPGLASVAALAGDAAGSLLAGGTLPGGLPGAARAGGTLLGADAFGTAAGSVTDLAVQETGSLVASVDVPEAGRVVRLLSDDTPDPGFALDGLAAARVRAPRALAVQPSGAIVVAGDRGPFSGREPQAFVLTRLYGGTTVSRVRIAKKARIRAGAARVKLTCTAGPGCEGAIGGRRVGEVSYSLRGGGRDVFAVPVLRAARDDRKLVLRVGNAPAQAVSRSVSLG